MVVPELPLALGLPITWVLPPYYTTSNILPGTSEVHKPSDLHRRRTSITYSVLSSCGRDDIIQQEEIVVSGTKIKTQGVDVLGCIQAKDQSGRLQIAACVRVAEVTQIRADTGSSPSHVSYLSLDGVLDVSIGYCDKLGYPFREAFDVIGLEVQTNYPDVVSILGSSENDKTPGRDIVHIKAKSHGGALVKISFKQDPLKAAYILVFAGPRLYPENPLIYTGCVARFNVTGFDGLEHMITGHWLSTNQSVISIDKHSGKAHAIAEGVTQVIYESPNLKLKTTATVKKMDMVTVNPPAEILTNIPISVKGHKFSLHFRDDLISLGSDSDISYDCNVEPPFIGYVMPWRDNNTGSLYCVLFPSSPGSLVDSLSKLKDKVNDLKSLTANGMSFVSVHVSPKSTPSKILGSSGQVLFIGGFSVSDDKLSFSPDFNKSRFTIVGNTDVEIFWEEKRLLLVKPVQKEHFGFAGRTEYEVEILKKGRFSDVIVIRLPATGQTAHINVSREDEREKAGSRERNTRLLWAAVAVSLILLALTIIIFLQYMDRPGSARSAPPPPPRPPLSGDLASTSTPGSTSTPPRTPQPFVEYLRHTLDETPYYKREGRRRFDPQRTY